MEKQLSFLLEKTKADLHENLIKLQQPEEQITDVTSAECYKRLRKARNLSKDDLTLLINTDGSPVWKSSKTSIWPLQFIVNELPPKVRFKHPILAGLWFGKKHPNMQLFLHTFVKELNGMKAIKWNHEAHTHVSKVAVLGCSVDAPARAATLNMVNFNGYFGCPWCLIPGEHTEGKPCLSCSSLAWPVGNSKPVALIFSFPSTLQNLFIAWINANSNAANFTKAEGCTEGPVDTF